MNFEHLASLTTGFSCADIIDDLVESGARVAANLDRALIDQNLLEEQITRIIHSKKDIGDNDNNRPDFIK
jgi:ATP-dependent 26S proteasome regulatory subunit